MAALDFPGSPTDGQQYEGYTYDSTKGAWQWDVVEPTIANLNDTVVGSPEEGDVLVYNGSAWVNGDPPPGDNLLYNGAMQVAQRGTSATGLTDGSSGYHTADRWRFSEFGTTTSEFTQTIEADGPTGSGFTKSLKLECTTAQDPLASDNIRLLEQRLEGQDLQGLKKGTSSAESLTFSFWVKSNVTGTYIVQFYDDDNARMICASYSVSAGDTWEKKTITFSGDTSGALDNDNEKSLRVRFLLVAGASYTSGTLATSWATAVAANWAAGQTNLAASNGNYWQVTGVQLETGTVATGFDHKPYGVELAECQRYYQVLTEGDDKVIANMSSYTSSSVYGVLHFIGAMRTGPSLEITTGTNYYNVLGNNVSDDVDTFNMTKQTNNSGRLAVTTGLSVVQGYSYWIETQNPSAYVALDAEL